MSFLAPRPHGRHKLKRNCFNQRVLLKLLEFQQSKLKFVELKLLNSIGDLDLVKTASTQCVGASHQTE
jgi:hypothetical protein